MVGSNGAWVGAVAVELRLTFSEMRPVGFGVRFEVSICRLVSTPWMILPLASTA
ncbi:hypothetical protein D3C80_1180600 [compost metagenome]